MSRNNISDGGNCPGFFVKKEKNKGMIRVKKTKILYTGQGNAKKMLDENITQPL